MLIVEDGTGIANADSYLSLNDARTLAANYGIVLPTDDTEAEIQLRKAYDGLNIQEPELQGVRTHDIQTGIYPRTGVYKNCVAVDSESIPIEVKKAQLYQAEAYTNGMNNNAVNDGQKLASFEVVGAYKEAYQDDSSQSLNSTVLGVDNELYPLTKAGFNASPCGGGSGFGTGLGREEFTILGQ